MTSSAPAPVLDPASTVQAFFAAMEDRAVEQALELADGRIVLWHDHFSWGNVLGGVVRGPFRWTRVSRPHRAPCRR